MTRRYRDSEAVDFVVIGSGAAGGVMARELTRSGFGVVLMEQGPRFAPQDFEHDELKYWFNYGLTNGPAENPQTFRKTPADEAHAADPLEGLPLTYARMVGGSSVHFTANFWRFHEVDFHERSLLGAIPGASLEDWPISYTELEPYYSKVEWEVGVSGLGGTHPNEPPRSRALPDATDAGEVLRRAARARRAPARPASLSYTARHSLGAVPRSPGLRALRVLHGLRLRGARQVLDTLYDDSGGRGHGSLRAAYRELRVPPRDQPEWPHHRRSLFRPQPQASTSRRRARSSCARTAPRRHGCC